MAFTGVDVIGIEWGFLGLTGVLVSLRVLCDCRIRTGVTVSTWFAVGAWIFFCFQTCSDTFLWSVGFYEGKISSKTLPGHFGPENGLATEKQTINALKILYAETVLYYSQMYCAKASMLAFYYSLFPRTMVGLRIAMWMTVGLTFVGWLSTLLLKIFLCQPIRSNWTPGPKHCNSMTAVISNDYRWTLHVLTDVLVYLLPLVPLRMLKLPMLSKVGVALTFAIGFVCIFFACLEQISLRLDWDAKYQWLYSDFEQAWALIVICCPAFRALFNNRTSSGLFSPIRSPTARASRSAKSHSWPWGSSTSKKSKGTGGSSVLAERTISGGIPNGLPYVQPFPKALRHDASTTTMTLDMEMAKGWDDSLRNEKFRAEQGRRGAALPNLKVLVPSPPDSLC